VVLGSQVADDVIRSWAAVLFVLAAIGVQIAVCGQLVVATASVIGIVPFASLDHVVTLVGIDGVVPGARRYVVLPWGPVYPVVGCGVNATVGLSGEVGAMYRVGRPRLLGL